MSTAPTHRIARQALDLRVDDAATARELHEELVAAFQTHAAPVLDEVCSAACPAGVTIRIDRVDIDAGVVGRDGVTQALAEALRDQLGALLREETPTAAPDRSGSDWPIVRLTDLEIVLERIALFFECGVVTWRDPGFTREALEAMLLDVLDSSPAALRRVLERLPASRAAPRAWTQLRVATRHRLLAWLGVADPAALDRAVAEWTAIVTAFGAMPVPGGMGFTATDRDVAPRLVTWIWTELLAGRPIASPAAAIGEHVLGVLAGAAGMGDTAARLERVHTTAVRILPAGSAVLGVLVAAVSDARREAHQAQGRTDAEGSDPDGAAGDAPRSADARAAARPLTRDDEVPARRSPLAVGATTGADVPGDGRPADRARAVERARAMLDVRADERGASTRRADTPLGAEPLWVAHAGLVIVSPFLPGLFDACGLIDQKRFVDQAARERAVLLTAHVANGLSEWAEHDLLLEKALCGYSVDVPVPSLLELRDLERAQAGELLGSVLEHWKALKGTSVDGLRRAFLSRPGTLRSIASGWKLEIPRSGHDVLLDSLPWGIGLVLLPWMEQPLHVEW